MANQKNSLGWFHITKNKIINNMYDIGRIENNTIIIDDEIDEVDFDLQKAINSAASLELIKNQYNRISKYDNAIFYLNHRLDSRYRVYVYNVPLNYQLSHVARATILIKQKIKINKTFKKFFNLKLVNENLYSEKLFTYQQINLETIFKVIDERNLAINKKIKTIEDSLKIECLIMVLSSLSPKKIKNIEEKLTFAENFLDIFLKENIETH